VPFPRRAWLTALETKQIAPESNFILRVKRQKVVLHINKILAGSVYTKKEWQQENKQFYVGAAP